MKKNARCPLSLVAIFKKSLFVLFNATAVRRPLRFLEKSTKTFLQFDLQKKKLRQTLKIYRNIYRKNLSAIIYR